MTVYVDDMKATFGRMTMCHMVADTTQELLAMADRIGVNRRWIQKPGTRHEHFDICMSKRAKAIEAGATPITVRQTVELIRSKRSSTPPPGDLQ